MTFNAISRKYATTPSALRQFFHLTGQSLRTEFASSERLLSPILFAVTTLLTLSFALGSIPPEYKLESLIAQIFITTFFALQLSFSRIFDADEQDRLFDVMRSMPISGMAWFFSKFAQVFILGISVVVPTIFFATILGGSISAQLSLGLLVSSTMSLFGLTAIGVLLMTLLLKASSRSLIFPLIYFPLTVPILLAAIETTKQYSLGGSWNDSSLTWLGLLAGFDVIYFVIGALFFEEIIQSS